MDFALPGYHKRTIFNLQYHSNLPIFGLQLTSMKPLYTAITFSLLLCGFTALAQSNTYFGNYFTHQCRDTNQSGNYTWLYHPELNGDSNAITIFTPNSLMGGIDEDFHCGLWYNKNISRWTVYSEQGSSDTMPLYSGFNVLIPTANGTAFKHKATAANIDYNVTLIDNPATNGKPNALLFISHNWGVSGGVYNNRATGVYYNNLLQKWGIFNEDLSDFKVNAVYNVFVVETPDANNAFIHTTGTPPLGVDYLSYFDYAATAGSGKKVFVTHNLSPNGFNNQKYDSATVGVAYKGGNWLVYNRDKSTLDSGTTFNVLVANNLPTGVEDLYYNDVAVQVYPNPANGYITINHSLNIVAKAVITNAMGQQVAVFDLLQSNTQADISQLPTGIYQLTVYNNQQRMAVKRLVKQ